MATPRTKKKTFNQSRLFEFKPNTSISVAQVIELCGLIRIGVSGDTLENASEELKKYFEEVK